MKKTVSFPSGAVLAASVFICAFALTGCGASSTQTYSQERFTAMGPVLSGEYRDGCAPAFAQDLCVVTDSASYEDSQITAEAAGLFDRSDRETLFVKEPFERLYPASITKVMTALIAIKYGNLNDMVTVTEDAVITESGATLCGIEPGDRLTLEQLLYGLMIPSGNDAGAAIAVHMSGSIQAFADLMNQEARKLGATDTHFVNPHGLTDPDHYTTAYDLYLIFNEALKYPVFRQITGTTSYTAKYYNGDGETISKTWSGGNLYLTGEEETPEGLEVFGGKTGTTSAAGRCLIMAVRDQQDREYISVVLKAADKDGLYDNMTNIISKIVK